MIFNSIPFALFLPIIFILYWIIGSNRQLLQNSFLLFASVFFYAWWDVRFLFLLFFAISIGYFIGFWLNKLVKKRRFILFSGMAISLSFLLFFKYYNFFITSFSDAFTFFGGKIELQTLKLILPLGISFYTFKIVGYLVDVYYRRIEVCKNPMEFFLFVSFFPQISAGPIENANSLLPQIQKKRKFNLQQASEGLKQILWGLFKKIAIADACSGYVNDIFSNYQDFPASVLIIGALYFAIQVYADFSGYSDIAIGIGKLFGFELMKNFNLPFLSKNITDFWRRWHISLTKWFNEYFFTPVYTSVRNWGNFGLYFAIFMTFLLSGLWHGANWNYILYGVFQGIAIVLETVTKKKRKKIEKRLGKKVYLNLSIMTTMVFILFTFIIFRSPTVSKGFDYISRIFSYNILEMPSKLAYLPIIFILLSWEWLQRNRTHAMDLKHLSTPLRWTIYLGLTFTMLNYYGQEQEFFYFQF
jgi:D-alanyl-lipoteichoic acid acyltransferase DltB (MBOAT superfamily)